VGADFLVAAPPTTTPTRRKEQPMAKPKAKGESAREVTRDVLRQAGEPLHAKEVATRVLASGRCRSLTGKTPEASVAALLAVGSKPGGPFKRVGKGIYTLADQPAPTGTGGASQPATSKGGSKAKREPQAASPSA
jgi:HB1, ASXL, restriction endonuclease HTH domain